MAATDGSLGPASVHTLAYENTRQTRRMKCVLTAIRRSTPKDGVALWALRVLLERRNSQS